MSVEILIITTGGDEGSLSNTRDFIAIPSLNYLDEFRLQVSRSENKTGSLSNLVSRS